MTRAPSSQSRAAESAAQGFDRRLIGPMVLGSILNPVNSSIIAVSLVPIGQAFGAPASQVAWLVSALYLATAIGQPVVGRLVDLFGPKRLLMAGGALTFAAGILGTFAPNLGVLIAARVVLGFGTCAGYPASMFLVRSEARRTGLASPSGVLTILSVSNQTVAVIGPTLGGLLIAVGGWRFTFAVNLILGLASLAVSALFVPSQRGPARDSHSAPAGSTRLDYLGICLFAATLVSLLLFLMNPGIKQLYLPAISVLSAAVLTWWELRHPEPFLDLALLGGNVPQLLTYARALLSATVSYAFLYGVTQWSEDGRHLSATTAGLLLVPMSALAVGVSALTGRRPEIRAKLLVGSFCQIVGCSLLLLLTGQTPIWLLVVVSAVYGLPQGLNNLAIQNSLYHQAHPARLGSSSGLLRTFMYAGAMAASALNGAFFGAAANTPGLHDIAVVLIGAAVVFLALTAFDRSLAHIGRPTTESSAAPA